LARAEFTLAEKDGPIERIGTFGRSNEDPQLILNRSRNVSIDKLQGGVGGEGRSVERG
jgi:hypothetical protein